MNESHNPDPNPNNDLPLTRLDELLADRAIAPLSPAEAAELRQLLNRAGKADDQSLDLAAAAFDRVLEPRAEVAIPDDLIARLEREGMAWCAGVKSAEESVVARLGGTTSKILESRTVRTPVVMGHRYLREWSGWVAAAACVTVGVYMFAERASAPASSGPTVVVRDVQRVNTATILPNQLIEDMTSRAVERLGRFFSGDSADVLVVPIGKAAPEAGTGGDVTVGEVFWSRAEGTGVVRISNISPEMAAGKNLQLWVFDSTRGQKHPINAGIISMRPGQTDALVTLDPTMTVSDAAAFVVTLEQPGGSVVAERDNMLALGFVTSGEGMAPPPVFIDWPSKQ